MYNNKCMCIYIYIYITNISVQALLSFTERDQIEQCHRVRGKAPTKHHPGKKVLGWLRLGWLKIVRITLNQLKHMNKHLKAPGH